MARKKKKGNADEGLSQGWMLTFCDLVTLLLTFFVMLNSMAVRDDKRVRLALGSLTDAFNQFKGGGFIDKKNNGGRALVGQTMENLRTQMEEITRRVKLSAKIKITFARNELKMSVKNAVLFERGTTKINESGKVVLAKVAEILKKYPLVLSLNGYASPSEVQNKGDPISLWDLSVRRSLSIVHFLVSYGIEPKRLQPYGLGSGLIKQGSLTSTPAVEKNRVDLNFQADDLKEFTRYLASKQSTSYRYKGFFFRLFERNSSN